MRIFLKKFGNILTSRQAGKEALAAFEPNLRALTADEKIEIDFDGVGSLTPSWADEFLIPIFQRYPKRVKFLPTDNSSVKETFALLEDIHKIRLS